MQQCWYCTASGDVAALYRHWLLSGSMSSPPTRRHPLGPLARGQYSTLSPSHPCMLPGCMAFTGSFCNLQQNRECRGLKAQIWKQPVAPIPARPSAPALTSYTGGSDPPMVYAVPLRMSGPSGAPAAARSFWSGHREGGPAHPQHAPEPEGLPGTGSCASEGIFRQALGGRGCGDLQGGSWGVA